MERFVPAHVTGLPFVWLCLLHTDAEQCPPQVSKPVTWEEEEEAGSPQPL